MTRNGTVASIPHDARRQDAGLVTAARPWDPVRGNAYKKKSRAKKKRRIFSHYGESCACCGSVDDLVIDHINGNGKEHREELGNKGGHAFYDWLIKQDFPDGFQTLCASCNASKGRGTRCRIHDDTSYNHRSDGNQRINIRLDRADLAAAVIRRHMPPDQLRLLRKLLSPVPARRSAGKPGVESPSLFDEPAA